MSDDRLRAAGAAALAEARRLFLLDVWDPFAHDHRPVAERWRDVITDMIGGDGRQNGLAWEWEGRYAGDGDFEWCGAFAARCWQAGGLALAARRASWASCYRLQRWASHRPAAAGSAGAPPAHGSRLCVPFTEHSTALPAGLEVRPGDVLIVGGVATGPGKHITIVERFDAAARTFHTYEGNAVGAGPDAKGRQGIVRARRPLGMRQGLSRSTYHARWLIRPAVDDLA